MMLQITINVNEAKVDPRDLMSWGLKMLKEIYEVANNEELIKGGKI